MKDLLSYRETFKPVRMDFYVDRGSYSNFIIADQCTNGTLVLWNTLCLNINDCEGNIFCHQFDGSDVNSKKEYLFAMDYLTNVLSAYRSTGKEIYKDTFIKIICEFHEFLETNNPVYDELPIYGQSLLIIKALDVLENLPFQNDFLRLLWKYACWLMNDEYYQNNDNHGMFQNIALLHLSVLFGNYPESVVWQNHAIKRINCLFSNVYYKDYTNNENSIYYFEHNNNLYDKAIQFCMHYKITGITEIMNKLKQSKEALVTFAHQDCSFPLIGDGKTFYGTKNNNFSRLFPDIGIAVLKVDDIYLSLKFKTVFQPHAHQDISSITARYKNIDFLVDTGQYNYDRYTPINRYVRSTAGHSGIFSLFADNLFQKDFCASLQYSDITAYENNGKSAFVRGEYGLKDVSVCREISVSSKEITIRDSWCCQRPTVLRQRFIIPKEFIEKSNFSVSKRTLESIVDNTKIRFEIIYDIPDILTVVQFGIAAPKYYEYEETMLLDTFIENVMSGEITAKITFEEE